MIRPGRPKDSPAMGKVFSRISAGVFWAAVTIVALGIPRASSAGPCPSQVEREVLARINAVRRSEGAPALRWNPRLARSADRHTTDMANGNFLSHRGSDGSLPARRMRSEGYRAASAETVGAGQPDPAAIVSGWLSSRSHAAILRSPRWTEIGVAYAPSGSRYRHVWTANFGGGPVTQAGAVRCDLPPLPLPASPAPQ